MTTLTLTPTLLNVLTAIKCKQNLAIAESLLYTEDTPSWTKSLREYFYELPQYLTSDIGLKRNERCIREIQFFDIPAVWNETEEEELHQFTFSY